MSIIDPATDAGQAAFDRVLAAVEEKGLRYRLWDGRAKVECPSHSDYTPSLDIGIGDQIAGVVMICRAGCDTGDVLTELGLTFRHLYDRPGQAAVGATRAYAERKQERIRQRVAILVERCGQQARIETGPAYWLRRADELRQVGTAAADESAKACLHRAMIASGFPW